MSVVRHGPLAGIRVVELAGIGPGPFACMLLADMGAEVLQVERAPLAPRLGAGTPFDRGRRSIAVNLKTPDGVGCVLRLADRADVLVEGYRPGVAERLGVGPDACRARNPRLVYARMTGWGQDGALRDAPGHDINYISVAGVLGAIGERGGPPVVPLNVVGDFGGGGMLLALGICAALVERARSGEGQVIDAAIVDGTAQLAAAIHPYAPVGWHEERGRNPLDGGAPYYGVYECADSEHVCVGAIEPQFYAALLRLLELEGEPLPDQHDQDAWPEMRERFAGIFKQRTRDEWAAHPLALDALVHPVLRWTEAQRHTHNVSRGVFVEQGGLVQPAPAPRFSRTPSAIASPPPARPAEHTDEALADWGFPADEIATLREAGAIV